MKDLMTKALMAALGKITFTHGDTELYKAGEPEYVTKGSLYKSKLPIKYGSVESAEPNKEGTIIIQFDDFKNKLLLVLKVGSDVIDIKNFKEVKAEINQILAL